ncbi:hypothetical protein GDO86_017230 [Hymenochirus boettgeri]|uniref:General transcription factor 3C polypeptide 1 n=1 Tax=Hymenochirus boettgeri TaxID=247094 RepID=A0A8T2IP93_9PIPI|nr:hypothetical protein GDO86_017230 [Hymenochirus boettgeri]
MDILEAVVDEVALEGLDGITLPALWLRLENRVPPFPLLLDPATKDMLWQSLVHHPELDIYQLPIERQPLAISDRYEGIDCDPAILKVKDSFTEDIYPVHIVSENKDGIQGSCQFFKQRVLLTNQFRTQSSTYEKTLQRWGEKLVIVGSQVLRFRALIGWEGDPSLELPDYSYCILEKLGRSRWQGELQKDLQGSFKADAGKVHYLRRALDRNGLITMQSHVVKLSNGTQQHSLLLLLKRFHIDRRNKYDMLTEMVSSILSECQNQIEPLVNLREQLGVPDQVFKRLYNYMANAGIVKLFSLTLQEFQPQAENCKTKRGTDIKIRCIKLIKEYKKKMDDSDEDEDMKTHITPVDIIYEKDLLTQTYELIESRGTKGISQTEIRMAINVGKLEARMLCRLLERNMLIKGFMEDEGRQRTTKFISHVFVEESDLRRQFLEEKAKSEKLSMFSLASMSNTRENMSVSQENTCLEENMVSDDEIEKKKRKKTAQSTLYGCTSTPKTQPKGKALFDAKRTVSKDTEKTAVLSENDCSLDSFPLESNLSTLFSHCKNDGDISVIEEVPDKKVEKLKSKRSSKGGFYERSHETYRLLKRRNIIVEAVKNLRIIESLFTLQKMITDHEKQEGVSTKCCKKSILRLVHKLSQEGLVRFFRTTVVQDGISKKVEFVVHPSINPSDPLVKSAIEQIRFRISSSTGNRTRSPQGPATSSKAEADDQSKDETMGEMHNASSSHSLCRLQDSTHDKSDVPHLKNYHPVIVPGLGRTLGYLPKMPRLKATHIFLWYVTYNEHLRKLAEGQISDKDATSGEILEVGLENLESTFNEKMPDSNEGETIADDENGAHILDSTTEQLVETVYVNDDSWMRYVPPATIHREYGLGWVLVSDVVLCLPLSLFIQIIQVSYEIENLEEYLNDPLKKHTLIKFLPRTIRQQLLYKRRYIFSVFQGLQKLSCMGLVQFGPSEKFQDKDQIFVYIKKKAMVVDTTACDPHYNIAQGSKPFDRKLYNFDTLEDVESYWFDLQFVCLNTPLGVVRCRVKKNNAQTQEENILAQDFDNDQEERPNLERKSGILESIPGSREVIDDGSIPGDGLGAGGLDSSFYSHLKRNWIWISYIINKTRKNKSLQDNGYTLRLQTFVNKHSLPLNRKESQANVLKGMNLSGKEEIVQVMKEPAETRNERVCGGKGQKRKKPKKVKETGAVTKAKKKTTGVYKRNRYHDEADKIALKKMTRLRVAWTAQEDGLLMLCRIASNILNKKVKRPFVPWQVVRDIMHSSLEESQDKTSHSIGRRTRYTVKNPQTYLSYKVCLAEVYQDKPLIEEFMSQKNNYNDSKVCAEEYKEFVERLKKKFSSTLGYSTFEIPDFVHELFARYRILAVGDKANQEKGTESLVSVDDVHVLVLQNLILSTLSLSDSQMKSGRILQTFRIYRAYRDDILGKAFISFQNKRLVNRRRVNHLLGPKKHRALPLVPMSYQLSQTYYRLFTWRFPPSTCTESFQFFEMLKICGSDNLPDNFSFMEQTKEEVKDMLMFPLDGPGGQCVTALTLILLGFVSINVKIPDQIVVVDSTLVENEVMKGLGKDGLDDEDFEDEDVDEPSASKQKIEVKARQASHTNYLLMRGYVAPGIVSTRNLNPNDSVVVNSCQVYLKFRQEPHSGKLQGSVSPLASAINFSSGLTSLPHHFTALLNMKKQTFNKFLSECPECYGYNSKDLVCVSKIYSAIEACSFRGMEISNLANQFQEYADADLERTRCLEQYIEDLVTSYQLLKVGGSSIRLVTLQQASPWVFYSDYVKESTTQDTESLIKDTDAESDPVPSENLPESNENLSESNEHCSKPPKKKARLEGSLEKSASPLPANYSTVESMLSQKTDTEDTMDKLHEREPNSCFLGRPWRIVDGTLNKPVCKGMLEAVMYHIMSKPGITEKTLLHHYSGVLQPVVVKELLEALEKNGCIKKGYIEKPSKTALFSCIRIPEQIKKPRMAEDHLIFYEPTTDCTWRLGAIFPSEVNWNKWVL